MEKVRMEKVRMEKVLYVTDLDGTLLNKNDRVSKRSIEIINRLVDRGMQFTYATARSLVSASVVTQGLSTKIPVIAYNGAFIFQPATGKILSREYFSSEEMTHAAEVIRSYGVKRYLSLRQGDRRLRPVENDAALYEGEIFYFTCIGTRDELMPVYDAFVNDARYRCTIQQELYRPEYFCEIMPAGATKANAIRKLKEICGCDKVISFGDAINDIPMFEISDECYAVENAVEELKAAADGVIQSNENDGVATWLEQHVRLNAEIQ